jgi:hypothetical protein
MSPFDEPYKSECISFKDTTKIELHTWYYYEPHSLISDSSYSINGEFFKEQNLFIKYAKGLSMVKLTYHYDTVFVTVNSDFGSYQYSAIKMSNFDTIPNPDMKLFGWSTLNSHSGEIIDSIFYKDDQIQVFKHFYKNGQLERHEYKENGEAKIFLYKENGRRIKRKNRIFNRYVYYLDSADVKYYSKNNELLFGSHIEGDTSIVKMFTWTHYMPHQSISDSSYYSNGKLIRKQELYWLVPEKIESDRFIYHGDTVFHKSRLKESTKYSQFTKTLAHEDNYDWVSIYGYKTDYKQFGWSITNQNEGYISDSTFYENGEQFIVKKFYRTGQLKFHRYQRKDETITVEYKKSGKIRDRIDSRTINLILGMTLLSIISEFVF